MQIYDISGKLVDIGGNLIPAVNIQIEGFPKYVSHQGTESWYPIYFEVLFETGYRWEVTQALGVVEIECYEKHNFYYRMQIDSWEEFLSFYKKASRP